MKDSAIAGKLVMFIWLFFNQIAPRAECAVLRQNQTHDHNMDWDDYHGLDDINGYMSYLASAYNTTVKLISIGKSFEGRSLDVIHISSNFSSNNPAIWIDGGIHAREWISPAVVTYFLHQLVEVPSNEALLTNVDYYIMPVVNVDGYVYSSVDRMWRKSRSVNTESNCVGTDLNRNFDIHWMETGSSDNPCSNTYAGQSVLSELESKALSKFILDNVKQIKMYLTFHSHGQYWLVPYGYDHSVYPADFEDMLNLAQLAANKTIKYKYTVGNTADLLYPSAGGSDDWAKSIGINYSYTIELPPNQDSQDKVNPFHLSEDQIAPVAQDFFPAIEILIQHISTKYA